MPDANFLKPTKPEEEKVEETVKKPLSLTEQLKQITDKVKLKLAPYFAPQNDRGAMMATDLIKGEVITYFDWQKNLTMFAAFLAIDFLLIFGGYKGVEKWQSTKQDQIDKMRLRSEQLEYEKKKAEIGLKEIDDFQRQLDQVAFMLNRHVYWTNFFDFLEKNTLAGVYYDNFGGSINGKYGFSAHAANFYDIEKQIEQFRSNTSTVISVKTGGGDIDVRGGTGAANFNFELSIKSDIFNNKDKKTE